MAAYEARWKGHPLRWWNVVGAANFSQTISVQGPHRIRTGFSEKCSAAFHQAYCPVVRGIRDDQLRWLFNQTTLFELPASSKTGVSLRRRRQRGFGVYR
jgi:hypothetical protein